MSRGPATRPNLAWVRANKLRDYNRACQIAWTGVATIALLCGSLGLIVALPPSIWLGLFSNDAEVARLGAMYLRIVGPVYVSFGRGFTAMIANAVRLLDAMSVAGVNGPTCRSNGNQPGPDQVKLDKIVLISEIRPAHRAA